MFEKSFIKILEADAALVSLLSEWEASPGVLSPAIFTDAAPQTAVYPYIVFDISKSRTGNMAIADFILDVNVYDDSASGVLSRDIAERIEFATDTKIIIDDDRFNTIRLYYDDGGPVENSDIKIRHYNVQVSARAGRSKWIDETIG